MSGNSPIFDAIEAHDLDRLATLIAGGSDLNVLKSGLPEWSPLHEAIEQLEDGGSIEALVLLLRSGARVDGTGGDTPLLMALFRAQPQAVCILLAAGAETNVRGLEGESPLRFAVGHGDLATAAALLRCGARATIDGVGAPTGASALGIAAKRLDAPMIKLLLQASADPDALDADYMTPRRRLPPRTPENAEAYDEAERLLKRP